MRAQRQRARILRLERLHQLGPQQPRGAHLGDFHEEVHADRPEEREARGELVDRDTGLDPGTDILDAVGERVGELEVLRRACLLHMVAGDRDRIELRHVRRRVGEDVRDDAQRWRRRIDVGVAHHEFFEDVVLDGAREFRRRHALLFGRDDVEREHRQHRAVHRHRHRHLVERDAGEQRAHVVDRVDRHARHADIAGDAGMVGVIAAVSGEIERDRKALLPGREVAAVERVGILRRREAGILPDGPRLRDVHRRVGAAQIGHNPRIGIEEVEPGDIVRAIDRLHRDALGREPGRRGARCRGLRGILERNSRKVRYAAHRRPSALVLIPRISCASFSVASTSQPAKMNDWAPAALNSASRSPGRPAR